MQYDDELIHDGTMIDYIQYGLEDGMTMGCLESIQRKMKQENEMREVQRVGIMDLECQLECESSRMRHKPSQPLHGQLRHEG